MILLPDEVLLGFIPHSFLSVSLDWVFVSDHCINFTGLDSGEIIKLSPLVGVFGVGNKLVQVSEIFEGGSFDLALNFDVDSLHKVDRNSLVVLFLFILLEFLDFLTVEDLFPPRGVLLPQSFSLLLLLLLGILLLPDLPDR